MSLPYRVILLGFSPFERSALTSYFRLATNRSPAYEHAEAGSEAHFLIVDADHAGVVEGVIAAGRMRDSVFIGGQAPDGAVAWMTRPIDPLHVLRELDAMVDARTGEPLPEPEGEQVPRTISRPPRARPLPTARSVAAPAPPPPVAVEDDGSGFVVVSDPPAEAPAEAATEPPRSPLALVIDDSDIAIRFLESKLLRHGVRVDRATTSAKAIELLSRNAYDFIFLDVELGPGSDLDGLALCQHIKRQHRHVGSEPVVTMVSAHHSELDRVRGTLAGADAYLGKPIDDARLARLLRQNGVAVEAAQTRG